MDGLDLEADAGQRFDDFAERRVCSRWSLSQDSVSFIAADLVFLRGDRGLDRGFIIPRRAAQFALNETELSAAGQEARAQHGSFRFGATASSQI